MTQKSETSQNSKKTKSGMVAILGAPNAGKSTLMNRFMGQKLSIVSPKVQTTRLKMVGIFVEDDTQIGFIDTPGIFAPKHNLDKAMVDSAWHAIEGADVVLWLVDASARLVGDKADPILEKLIQRSQRVILVLNKVDKIATNKLLPLAQTLTQHGLVDEVFMISAQNGDGIKDLKKYLMGKMPEGPWLFDAESASDMPARLMAAELTREQLYFHLDDELPYAATVEHEKWEERKDGSVSIHQTIYVMRQGQKPIILGKGGAKIKSIGTAARGQIEKLLGHKVHLFLEVKVDPKWQDRVEIAGG